LRVTVVAPYGVLGGAELWLLALLAAGDRLAVDAVLLGDGPLRAELGRLRVPVTVLPTGRRVADLTRATARLAGRLAGPHRPDLVLANGVKAALVAAPAAALAGVRCVWARHDHTLDGLPARVLARLVDAVVASSPEVAAGTGRTDAVVLLPPRPDPPLPAWQARAVLAGYGLPGGDDRLVLAAVGRLVRYKGVEDAVRALSLPGAERWTLVVLGEADRAEPDELNRLRRLATSLGVAGRVVFTGWVPDAGRLLAGVDAVAVLTKPIGSGPGREGFGMAAQEAMLAGVPVIATGPSPVVDRLAGQAGLAVPPGDPPAVAAALARLADPHLRARLGAAGRALVAAHPDARVGADRLAGLLARTARRAGAGLAGTAPISAVVTVRDEADAVDRLLGLLAPQLRQAGDEVVVVDGGSVDGTVDRVRRWAARDDRVRLLVQPGAGISAGRNAGVRAARNPLVAVTDAGCDPAPGWLDALRAAAAEPCPAGLLTGVYRVSGGDRVTGRHRVGGPSRVGDGPLQAALAAVGYPDPDELRHPSLLARGYGRVFGRAFDPSLPTGRSMAFAVSAWRAAGGFPEHLDTAEDVLFGRAVATAGIPAVLVADAEVGWRQRPTLAATVRMYRRYGEGSGRSRDRRLLGRDLARLVWYAAGPVLPAVGGRSGRLVLAAGWVGYLSLPVVRVLRRRRDTGGPTGVAATAAAVLAVPVAAAARDLAKVGGAVRGLRSLPARGPTGQGGLSAGANRVGQ
jgi:glycosyltransferase involved in cell wall biosynthesis